MTKLVLLSLLILSLTPAHAANPPKACPSFIPQLDPANWTWMDRDCHIRTRAELDRILENHNLWVKKFAAHPDDQAATAHGVWRDPLRADLSGAQLHDADLTGANLIGADLAGADFTYNADLTDANLSGADLLDAHLETAHMVGANLMYADLTGAHLQLADLTGAILRQADLTGANLWLSDLTGTNLMYADLTSAILYGTHLTGAPLDQADLTGADLSVADLTGAYLTGADLSSATLRGTDLSDADLTFAKLWYTDFEPMILPPVSLIARTEGLQTLRWSESFDEIGYRHKLEEAGKLKSQIEMPRSPSSLPDRWILWLSRYREILTGQTKGWRDDLGFLWNDAFYGLQLHQSKQGPLKKADFEAKSGKDLLATKPQNKGPDEHTTEEQNQYSLIDLRNALNRSGYSEAELQVNLAYQRHTQSVLDMILYDWTCEYGASPFRPLIIALALAILAVPLYWLAIRQGWFGSQLLLVEKRGQEEIESPVGSPLTRPSWRAQVPADPPSGQARPEKLSERLHLRLASNWLQLCRLIASCWPRLRWEAGFVKAVALFSLIGIVNLGFEGLDFGRWIRNLTFREYDLKARGGLRTASGLQSLVGLALLALSLLSFFGHRFE